MTDPLILTKKIYCQAIFSSLLSCKVLQQTHWYLFNITLRQFLQIRKEMKLKRLKRIMVHEQLEQKLSSRETSFVCSPKFQSLFLYILDFNDYHIFDPIFHLDRFKPKEHVPIFPLTFNIHPLRTFYSSLVLFHSLRLSRTLFQEACLVGTRSLSFLLSIFGSLVQKEQKRELFTHCWSDSGVILNCNTIITYLICCWKVVLSALEQWFELRDPQRPIDLRCISGCLKDFIQCGQWRKVRLPTWLNVKLYWINSVKRGMAQNGMETWVIWISIPC